MISVGALALGLGYVEHADQTPPRPPLVANIWFDFGVTIVLVGLVLTSLTLVALTVAAGKSRAFHELLGRALTEGQRIERSGAEADVTVWVERTHQLIRGGLGAGEAALFLNDSGYTRFIIPGVSEDSPHYDLLRRLRRLTELVARVKGQHVDIRFDPRQFTATV